MTRMAHRRSSSPVCGTCQRRDRMLAALVIVVFVAVFVIPTLLRWHG